MSTATVTLGGSSAAAACGIHPYVSRVELWAHLTGRMPTPETEPMLWGTLLEPVVKDELIERGYHLTGDYPAVVSDPERPWLIGHPDGVVVLDQLAVLEVKTASPFAWPADDSVPLHYQAQAQVYMHLLGYDLALVACLVGGQRLAVTEVPRSQAAQRLLLDGMEDFMGYVERDEPPPPDGSDSAADALRALYPDAVEGKRYRLTRDDMAQYERLRSARERIAAIEAVEAEAKALLQAAMGEAQVAVTPADAEVLRWSSGKRRALDVSALRAAHPGIADEFTTTNPTRRFTVT